MLQIGLAYAKRPASRERWSVGAEMDLKEYLDCQTKEIERHKWIESERAGRDLGLDAVIDWIQRYADAFSDSFIQEKCRD